MTVAERSAELAKDVNVKSVGFFGAALPTPFIPQAKLSLNSVITFPTEYNGDNTKARTFNNKDYYFAICDMIQEDNTQTTYDFYPCSIVRPGFAYKLDARGKAIFETTVPNKGSLIELIASYIGKDDKDVSGKIVTYSTQKAMDALKGKKAKVTGVVEYQTVKWVDGKATDELITKQAYTIDLL